MLKLFIFLVILANLQIGHSIRLEDYFRDARIVPDIIPIAPQRRCNVIYPNKTIETGLFYPRGELLKEPNVTWSDCDIKSYYSIIMTLLDEVKDDKVIVSELHWWLIMNIKKCCISVRKEVFNYALLNRLPYHGAHRVVLLVYKQASMLAHQIITKLPNATRKDYRKSFTIKQFVEKHDLGHPVAGNAFRLAY